jgi:hypothetical protein
LKSLRTLRATRRSLGSLSALRALAARSTAAAYGEACTAATDRHDYAFPATDWRMQSMITAPGRRRWRTGRTNSPGR